MSKVLIVEDDPMVARINQKYLEHMMACEVYGPVATEEEVVEILQKEAIDLILMDEYLPRENGLEILKSLRNQGFWVHVIMITAANRKEDVQKAYAYGAIDYLVKPFKIERFREAVDKYYKMQALLEDKQVVMQQDIDEARGGNLFYRAELPKGINKKTLEKILEVIEEEPLREWTLRGLAKEVDSSNVTVKKYMDYLETTGQVKAYLASGQVGRPEYKYQANGLQ